MFDLLAQTTSYSAAEILLFVGAIGVILRGMITDWRSGNKLTEVATAAVKNQADLQTLSETAVAIKTHVNSESEKRSAEYAAMASKLEIMKAEAEADKADKALLAKALVVATALAKTEAAQHIQPQQVIVANAEPVEVTDVGRVGGKK